MLTAANTVKQIGSLLLLLLLSSTQLITLTLASNVLVLVDNLVTRETHSQFLRNLQQQEHQLTIKSADDSTLQLIKYGRHLYDHLLLLSPGVDEFGGSLSVQSIVDYVDNGGNLMITGDVESGDAIRELICEFGLELDEQSTTLVDHFHFDARLDNGSHNVILSSNQNLLNAPQIVGSVSQIDPILYRGAALFTSNKPNPLLFKVFTASPTAYSYAPNKQIIETPNAVGQNAILVAAVQARNNARVVITGSLDLLSDKFFNHQLESQVKSGNAQFASSLINWVTKQTGVLRVAFVQHHRQNEQVPPESYTILDQVEYKIKIEILNNGQWIPFDGDDVQLEFVRMDPFVRTTLKREGDLYVARFKLPDVYGVFKFVVDYNRIGYTHLYSSTQVSVRPLEHTQYERFISSAYPYYASAFSMMFGVFLFSFVFLYHKDKVKTKTQ